MNNNNLFKNLLKFKIILYIDICESKHEESVLTKYINNKEYTIYDTCYNKSMIFNNNNNIINAEFQSETKYIRDLDTKDAVKKQIQINKLTIPKSVVYIDKYAFKNLKIKMLEFDKNSEIDYINQEAFANCDLEKVVFNDNINKNNYKRIINNTAFDGNKNITDQLNKLYNK
jgi:hypothetical protein